MIDVVRKVTYLAAASKRVQTAGILLTILLGMFLETLSIAMVFPLIKGVLNPEDIETFAFIGPILRDIAGGDPQAMIAPMAAIVMAVFLGKNILLMGIYFIQARFTANNVRTISIRLYNYYLNAPLDLHLNRNTSDLYHNVHNACQGAFVGGFMGLLTLLSEVLVTLGIIALLLTVSPKITISAFAIILIAVGAFYYYFRQKVIYWGERELQTNKEVLKTLDHGLHSIKETKILARENFFLSVFLKPLNEKLRLVVIRQLMMQAPRLWVESVIMICGFGFILYAALSRAEISVAIPYLSVFAVAAMRLIPSANRIINSLQRVDGARHSINVVYSDVRMLEQANLRQSSRLDELSFERELSIHDVTFKYEGMTEPAVSNISLSIKKGESIGLVGPSGSGKSTLANLILTLLEPTSGEIRVDGQNIFDSVPAWRRNLGYVPQEIYLIDDTLRRNIAFGVEDKDIDDESLRIATQLAQLEPVLEVLPHGMDTEVGERGARLSAGQRQRVGIARALYRDPPIVVFDEATSALDNETEHEMNQAINRLKGKKTILIIAHRLNTVRKCDRLVFLKDGRIEGIGGFEALQESHDGFRRLVNLTTF